MSIFQSGYGQPQQRGRGKLRLIIAAIIIIAGVVKYYSSTQTNPVTGEKQRVAMTADEEKLLGLEAAPKMAAEMGGVVSPDNASSRMVAEVGRKLIESTEARKSPYADNFHFLLLADPDTVNAFALPGGQVFITRALYDRLQSEAQLAGVLGHEIGHVINRHAAEHMAKGQLGQMIVTGVVVGASDDRNHGQMAAAAAMMASQMLQLKYGRQDELESDAYGMRIMPDAGYDPGAMRGVMEILKDAAKGRGGSAMFSTHPDPDARIEQINMILHKYYPGGVPPTLSQGRKLP